MGKSIGKHLGKYKAFLILLLMMASCYRHHLYVQQEWVDRTFLASTHVNTPDPQQANPPEGQRLLIAWDFPRSVFQRELTLKTEVRFWSDQQKTYLLPISKKRGYTAIFFPKEKILTYRVQMISKEGDVVETWKHHFWTDLIEVGETPSNSSSVSSQPMHESVMDRP
jgi:hypothetical protein